MIAFFPHRHFLAHLKDRLTSIIYYYYLVIYFSSYKSDKNFGTQHCSVLIVRC